MIYWIVKKLCGIKDQNHIGQMFAHSLNNSTANREYLVSTDRTPVLFFAFQTSNPAEYG